MNTRIRHDRRVGRCFLRSVAAGGALLLGAWLPACVPESTDPDYTVAQGELDTELRRVLRRTNLSGDPISGRGLYGPGAPWETPLRQIEEDPVARLGMQLFYTTHLSGDDDTACVSCHVNTLGGGDGVAMSLGPGTENPALIGPGRKFRADARVKPVPRNAPTMFNAAAWDRCILQDCGIESLGATPRRGGADGNGIATPDFGGGRKDPTASDSLLETHLRFPLADETFMRGRNEPELDTLSYGRCLAEKLGGYGACGDQLGTEDNPWPARFAEVFGGDAEGSGAPPPEEIVTFGRITKALLAYEHTLTFAETPWRRYIGGDDDALDEPQKRGALLFYRPVREGGANCVRCHTGDLLSDEKFHNTGLVQIGPGRANPPFGDADFGRANVSGQASDRWKFRTPTLLNVEVTWPWGHNGAYDNLYDVILAHVDPVAAYEAYEFRDKPFTPVEANARYNTERAIEALQKEAGYELVHLEPSELADLVAFMNALTDPCVKSRTCLAPWDPFNAGLADERMGLLHPVDARGCSLVEINPSCTQQ